MELQEPKVSFSLSSATSVPVASSWRSNLWNNLVTAWTTFDRVVGNFIGLDEPRFAWAVHEHHIQQREKVRQVD